MKKERNAAQDDHLWLECGKIRIKKLSSTLQRGAEEEWEKIKPLVEERSSQKSESQGIIIFYL